jgi:hypothetical protein
MLRLETKWEVGMKFSAGESKEVEDKNGLKKTSIHKR